MGAIFLEPLFSKVLDSALQCQFAGVCSSLA